MPDAALQGSLASFKLPDVLTFLQATKKSGTLSIRAGEREAHVFFEWGAVIYAGSNQEHFRLSAILLRKKRITRAEFELIDQLMRNEGGRFGQIAIQQGILTDAQLHDFLKVQVSEILYDCFVWAGGQFDFVEELQLPEYAVTIAVDLGNLIMEGARRIEQWEQCIRLLPDNLAVFRVISNPEKGDRITLSVDEWRILFLINGARTLEELCNIAEDDPFDVYRVVYGLYANKLIEVVPREPGAEDTGGGATAITVRSGTGSGDETIRQAPVTFGADSTVREMPDDTSLLVSSEAKLSYKDVVKPTVAQLAFLSGELQGTVIPLIEPDYLIGRQRDNQIQIPDLGVSGFHARIFRGPEGYVVEDLKSRNGTWVNSSRIFHALLHHEDRLRFGATELQYTVLYDATDHDATVLKTN